MTNPAIIDKQARAIHCHDGRLPTPWDADMIARWPDDCEYERKVAMSQAAAVLELIRPKPLVWSMPDKDGWRRAGEYHLGPCNTAERQWGFGLVLSKISWHPTLESAQAAAKAHADAAHWANTKIGGK